MCRGNLAHGRLQGRFHEFLQGLSRLPHIDAVNATVLLVVGMHDPASGQMGVDVHQISHSVPPSPSPSASSLPALVPTSLGATSPEAVAKVIAEACAHSAKGELFARR